jgi:hypothetical protein
VKLCEEFLALRVNEGHAVQVHTNGPAAAAFKLPARFEFGNPSPSQLALDFERALVTVATSRDF